MNVTRRFSKLLTPILGFILAGFASQHDWLPRDWLLGPLQIREGDASVHENSELSEVVLAAYADSCCSAACAAF